MSGGRGSFIFQLLGQDSQTYLWPLQQLDWLGTATVTPLIQKGFLRPAADLEFLLIAYGLDGSPLYQSVHSPISKERAALAPQFEKGRLVPVADWEFPIVAYSYAWILESCTD